MNYIVLDLEATCDKHDKAFKNETIEIGAVKLTAVPTSSCFEQSYFNAFVKPIVNPILTPFCKELTTISQEQVDTALAFKEVIEDFKSFIGSDYLLCSWGFYDKHQFIKDLTLHKLDTGWVLPHISLKHQFAQITNRVPCGMNKALRYLNLPLHGVHHRGIDDAINITQIFLKMFASWDFNPTWKTNFCPKCKFHYDINTNKESNCICPLCNQNIYISYNSNV
jgi:inhibitor of KinA sporulation pathway (predicted exonuclease)